MRKEPGPPGTAGYLARTNAVRMNVPSEMAMMVSEIGEDDANRTRVAAHGLRGARADRADSDGCATGGKTDFDRRHVSRKGSSLLGPRFP